MIPKRRRSSRSKVDMQGKQSRAATSELSANRVYACLKSTQIKLQAKEIKAKHISQQQLNEAKQSKASKQANQQVIKLGGQVI